MHFSQAIRIDDDVSSSGGLGDGKVGRISDSNFTSRKFDWFLFQHAVSETVLRRDGVFPVVG